MENEQRTRTKVVRDLEDCYFRAEEVARYLSMLMMTFLVLEKYLQGYLYLKSLN